MSWRRWLAIAAGVVALSWLVAVGIVLFGTYRDLRAGRDAVTAARELLGPSDLADGRPIPQLREAHARFDRARHRVHAAIVTPLEAVPVVGRQVRSVRALASAAARVTDVGLASVTSGRDILHRPHGSPVERLAVIDALRDLAATASRDLAAIDLGPSEALVGPLADAHDQLSTDVARVRTTAAKAEAATSGVARLLSGPRRYLVIAANNAEMRAGSGMWLSIGELTTNGGSLELGDMTSVTDVDVPPGVPLDRDVAALWGALQPETDFRNLMLSPRFDVSARAAVAMWQASGHDRPDGVLVLDPVALRALVAATGPVDVDGRRVDASSIVDELLHGQYVRHPDFERVGPRREALGTIARQVTDAIDRGNWDVPTLASGLSDAALGRHVLAWSADPQEQRAWAAAGIDGSIADDALLLAVSNRGGNKLDPFLHVSADLSSARGRETNTIALRVRLENTVPQGEPRYIAGPNPATTFAPGEYVGYLALSLPADASRVRVDGAELLETGRDGNSTVVVARVALARGATAAVSVRFEVARGRRHLVIVPSARVPSVTWRAQSVTWTDERPRTVTF